MANYLDMEKLASLVRTKRQERGLREVSKEIGTVSPSTISRVENGKVPDIDTFLALCDWLDVSPADLLRNEREQEIESTPDSAEPTVPERIAFLLRSDPHLDPAMANALALLIKNAYPDFLKPS